MNNTTISPVLQYSESELVAWCSAYGLLAALIIAGNGIAIAVLTRKRLLRKRTSYFLLSLGIADMLVGCVSVPMHIYQLSYSLRGMFLKPSTLYNIIRSSDVFCSLASTFTLTIIALERVYAITFPLQHRVTTKRVYHALVCSVWILSAVLSSFYFLFTFRILDHKVFFYFMMVTFFLSLAVMLIAYLSIWFKVRMTLTWDSETQQPSVITTDSFTDSRNAQENTMMMKPKKHKNNTTSDSFPGSKNAQESTVMMKPQKNKDDTRPRTASGHRAKKESPGNIIRTSGKERTRRGIETERKLAATLFIVTAVFVVTWLPFQIINMIIFFACRKFPCPAMPPYYAIYFCKLLNYSNSFLNPVIYSLRLPDFRLTLRNNVLKYCI